ncbi:MAG: penicillin-binding protein [Acidimicrobiaceae bacterium]|nr:penicillin-binding protein [Acidimicrobiaceae bacterium]MDQ1418769.1 penicillin-binding protein [Acidimicrobiaceae bacterium]MDQ1441622.1 penicillin-binding protein [Acidimicrobiaceae bacterium]
MNRQIRVVGIGVIVMFLVLFGQLNYVQVVRATGLDHNRLNTRLALAKFTTKRGDINSADGVILAHSQPTSDSFKYQRTYPTNDLFGQVTGYFSFTYGLEGAERTFDADLTGANAPFQLPKSLKDLTVKQDRSQTVTLTLSNKLQQLAKTQLGSRKGAVVALDPSTGAILALWSNPSFDPNPLAAHDQTQVRSYWQAQNANTDQPLLAASFRRRFFPGSTFKMITASAVFDKRPDLATKAYPQLPALPLPQTGGQVLRNFGGEVCGGPLPDLFRVSCNSGFAAIGLDLGAQALADEATGFGFDQTLPIDLPEAAQSLFPAASTFAHDLPGLAKSAIGQQNVQAVPLGMALVAAGIANGGVIMKPHILAQVADSQGQVVRTYQPSSWLTATSAQTATQMTQLMTTVVQSGTGTAARIPGIDVAGKTGTAQTGNNTIHAWFVCFAPAIQPKVAVAVLVENQPEGGEATGGVIAAPIAKAVLQAALQGP